MCDRIVLVGLTAESSLKALENIPGVKEKRVLW